MVENVKGKIKESNTKKYLIVLILKILESNTDKEHCMTQTEIAKMISGVYSCDRKTVGRNIKFLIDLSYPIVKTTKGFYMDKKKFSVDDVEYVSEAINAFQDGTEEYKINLINDLKSVLGRVYKR